MTSARTRVVVAGCRSSPDADAGSMYPDEDWPVLRAALEALGAEVTLVAWDNLAVDWGKYDVAVVRSTWDSVDRPQLYLEWARRTGRVTKLLNPYAVLRWNMDKAYLRQLQQQGVPVIPTLWVSEPDDWQTPLHPFVVKPSLSAGGRETARYEPDEATAAGAHVRRLLARGQTVMVQPYMASVDGDGEAKLVFVDGAFSHAVRVGPLLDVGTGVGDRPWEKPVRTEAITPSGVQLAAAGAVLDALNGIGIGALLYARVDLVVGAAGMPALAEVELVDPSLMLRFAGAAADRLAEAIVARALPATRRQ